MIRILITYVPGCSLDMDSKHTVKVGTEIEEIRNVQDEELNRALFKQ